MKKLNCFLITIIFFTICSCEKRESEFNPPPYPYELCVKENTFTITLHNKTSHKYFYGLTDKKTEKTEATGVIESNEVIKSKPFKSGEKILFFSREKPSTPYEYIEKISGVQCENYQINITK